MERVCLLILLLSTAALRAGEPTADRGLSDSLKAIHNRGADLFNRGDAAGCLRLFEGALEMARAALPHRPEEQKLIRTGLDRAAAIESMSDRTFALHELIEDVRKRLVSSAAAASIANPAESIPVVPRESGLKPAVTIAEPKVSAAPIVPAKGEVSIPPVKVPEATPVLLPVPVAEVIDPKTSLSGRFFWDGEGLEGVNLMLVRRDGQKLKVFETATGPEGRYTVKDMEAGRYTVVLDPLPGKAKHALPDRYRSSETSPLIYNLAPGEKHDFLLK